MRHRQPWLVATGWLPSLRSSKSACCCCCWVGTAADLRRNVPAGRLANPQDPLSFSVSVLSFLDFALQPWSRPSWTTLRAWIFTPSADNRGNHCALLHPSSSCASFISFILPIVVSDLQSRLDFSAALCQSQKIGLHVRRIQTFTFCPSCCSLTWRPTWGWKSCFYKNCISKII